MLKDFFKRFKECVGTTVWLPPSLFYHVLQNDTKSQKINYQLKDIRGVVGNI